MSKLIMKHRCWCGGTEFEIPGPGEVVCKKCSREHAYQIFFADEEDLVCAYCESPANYVALVPSVSLYVCEKHKSRTGTVLVPIDGTTAPDGTGGSAVDEASSPASASQPNADEKGLKLSHRLILRFVVEYGRSLKAFARLGGSTELATLVNEANVLVTIGDLLALGMGLAERLGNPKEVIAYLDAHEEDDIQQVANTKEQSDQMLHEHIKGRVEKILLQGDPCPQCGAATCIQCKTCHRCEEAKIEAAKKEQLN